MTGRQTGKDYRVNDADFLLIGSGIGGLTFALKVAEYGRVSIITKKNDEESSTNYAQGGIAAVISPDDSFRSHIDDTLSAGAGLCKPDVVETVIKEGPNCIRQLQDWGVNFTRTEKQVDHDLALGREGGHSHNRIVYSSDRTGTEVERALLDQVRKHPNIQVYPHHCALDLIVSVSSGTGKYKRCCRGAYVLDSQTGNIEAFTAKIILLATGGCGHVYLHTSNPSIATGDGIAMAYRAGAVVANLEFMQFHPTTLYHPEARSFLISEAVRGFGGILLTRSGERFMEKYHSSKELAPRDIVARAIDRELKLSGDSHVFLDLTHLRAEDVKQRFPYIYQRCNEHKIDITVEPIPVVPAAHYMCGGVKTNLQGHTSIRGLYATGEVAHTGLHGANRLASNSLLEALVLSNRAAQSAARLLEQMPTPPVNLPRWRREWQEDQEEWVLISHDRVEIQRLMWDYVGIVRSNHRLARAGRRLKFIAGEVEDFYQRARLTDEIVELRNIVQVAQLI
ncbi:L-aspartate oxidase, partial [bacterium]|nr:L-aspartate oxidase [bacterium]